MPVVEAIRRLERDGLSRLFQSGGLPSKSGHDERLEAYCIRRAL